MNRLFTIVLLICATVTTFAVDSAAPESHDDSLRSAIDRVVQNVLKKIPTLTADQMHGSDEHLVAISNVVALFDTQTSNRPDVARTKGIKGSSHLLARIEVSRVFRRLGETIPLIKAETFHEHESHLMALSKALEFFGDPSLQSTANICDPTPCNNGGTCVPLVFGTYYYCVCASPYAGPRNCNFLDPCSTEGGYCYESANCSTEANESGGTGGSGGESNCCFNGGVCQNSCTVSGCSPQIACACPNYWVGEECCICPYGSCGADCELTGCGDCPESCINGVPNFKTAADKFKNGVTRPSKRAAQLSKLK